MHRIAIVNDEISQAESTARYVREYMKSRGVDTIVEIYDRLRDKAHKKERITSILDDFLNEYRCPETDRWFKYMLF